MQKRQAFVDNQEAAKDFVSGDIVRKTDFRGFFPSPYVGKVIYTNPKTGTVTVQWPWGFEQESPTWLFRDVSSTIDPNDALDQWYTTWEGARLINDKQTVKEDEKWRKKLATIITEYEQQTLPLWRLACKAHYENLSEIEAFNIISAQCIEEFGTDAIRLTIANLYESPAHLHVALYWKDSNRRYKVTRKEKETGKFKCPRCGGLKVKPRVYRQSKRILQCRDCGFSISSKDLIWDDDSET